VSWQTPRPHLASTLTTWHGSPAAGSMVAHHLPSQPVADIFTGQLRQGESILTASQCFGLLLLAIMVGLLTGTASIKELDRRPSLAMSLSRTPYCIDMRRHNILLANDNTHRRNLGLKALLQVDSERRVQPQPCCPEFFIMAI
jgi:hypothetical protein